MSKLFERKIVKKDSYPSVVTCAMCAHKNRLIETVILSTPTYVLVEI